MEKHSWIESLTLPISKTWYTVEFSLQFWNKLFTFFFPIQQEKMEEREREWKSNIQKSEEKPKKPEAENLIENSIAPAIYGWRIFQYFETQIYWKYFNDLRFYDRMIKWSETKRKPKIGWTISIPKRKHTHTHTRSLAHIAFTP